MEIKKRKQKLYASPEVEVMELKARQVMCTSGNGSYPGLDNDDNPYGF